jgi:uncharacterized protein
MPRLDRDRPAQGPLVQAFSGNGFKVDGIVHATGLKLTPLGAIEWQAPQISALTAEDVADLLALQPRPEFLLLGSGATLRRPNPSFLAALQERGVGIELMDSRAAARAWGVLRGEDRWIAAALMPLDQL